MGVSLGEIAPPTLVNQLKAVLKDSVPQLDITAPQAGQLIKADSVTLELSLKGLSIFKAKKWELGPHIGIWLDDQEYRPIYELSQPITFQGLNPGTHQIRAIAEYPWNESFKNPEAYDQVSFDIFTSTIPDAGSSSPQLLLSQPIQGVKTDPLMLDYVVKEASASSQQALAPSSSAPKPQLWKVKATLNGTSFPIDENGPIYLKNLPSGDNWLKVELLDQNGRLLASQSNEQTQLRRDHPDAEQSLIERIFRSDIPLNEIGPIVGLPEPKPVLEEVKVPASPQPTSQPKDSKSAFPIISETKPLPLQPSSSGDTQIREKVMPKISAEIQKDKTVSPTLQPSAPLTAKSLSEPLELPLQYLGQDAETIPTSK